MNVMNDYVLIRVDEVVTQTTSGIMLQDKWQRLPSTGVIEAIAPSVKAVKVGDKVEFLRYASIDGTEEGTRFCKLEHILAKIDA